METGKRGDGSKRKKHTKGENERGKINETPRSEKVKTEKETEPEKEKRRRRKRKKEAKEKSRAGRRERRVERLVRDVKRGLLLEAAHRIPKIKRLPQGLSTAGSDGLTALHWAALMGDEEMCGLLLDSGAFIDVSSQTNDASTPLHYACLNDLSDIAMFLVNHGADIRVRNRFGLCAEDLGVGRMVEEAETARMERMLQMERERERLEEIEREQAWRQKLCDEGNAEEEWGASDWREERAREEEAEERRVQGKKQRGYDEKAKKEEDDYGYYCGREEEREKAKRRIEQEQERRSREAARLTKEEEERRERARQKILAVTRKKIREKLEVDWQSFEEGVVGKEGRIVGFGDIPFPAIDEDEANGHTLGGFDVLSDETPIEDREKVLKAAYLRWHPDKFVQRFGRKLKEEDRELVLEHVTRITQHISRLKELIKGSTQEDSKGS